MIEIPFIILSILFQLCLACTDAYFNKMIRKNIPNWEELKDFKWITLVLLIGCTFLPPGIIALFSLRFAAIYGLCYCFVWWDLIFGKIVYGKWRGDMPSIKVGGTWHRMKLWKAIALRVLIGIGFICVLILDELY